MGKNTARAASSPASQSSTAIGSTGSLSSKRSSPTSLSESNLFMLSNLYPWA